MPIREAESPQIRSRTGIHLDHFFLSNCAQRVALAWAEKTIDFEAHSINLLTRVNTRDEYFRINPAGLVPALVHDVLIVTESIDIQRYLEDRFPDPALYPLDPAEKKRVDQWMDEATNTITVSSRRICTPSPWAVTNQPMNSSALSINRRRILRPPIFTNVSRMGSPQKKFSMRNDSCLHSSIEWKQTFPITLSSWAIITPTPTSLGLYSIS